MNHTNDDATFTAETPPPFADLIQLLREIRPSYGDVGSRDVDVSAKRKKIDAAIDLLSRTAQPALTATKVAEERFTEYFVKNYPADTIIINPAWHARKIFNAVLFAMRDAAAPETEAAQPATMPEGWKQALHAAVSAIYFDDSSDYRTALGSVVRFLDAKLAGELLCTPKAAYDKACAMLEHAAAPSQQVTCQPEAHFEWEEAQRICDLSTVDEAIRGFAEDQTGNNATCMVLAILEATLKTTAQLSEQKCVSNTAESTSRRIHRIVLDSTAEMDASLAKLRTAIDELVKRPSKSRNKKSS